MATKLSSSPTLPTYCPTGFTGLAVIEPDDFYGENSREIQKADRALELASRSVLCHHFGIFYDCVLWHDGRGWVASDYWLRPATDRVYDLCLFAPPNALSMHRERLFDARRKIDFDWLSEDPRSVTQKREAYKEIREDLDELLEDNWQAIKVESEILFKMNDLRGFGERCRRRGMKFGDGISASRRPAGLFSSTV